MSLTFDPAGRELMRDPPRKLGSHILDRQRLVEIAAFGVLMGLIGYASFYMVLAAGGSTGAAQAAAFAGIALTQYVNILSRRTSESVIGRHLFANRQLWLALLISATVVAVIVSVPGVGLWFGFEPMRPEHWIWPIGGALVYLACFEAKKMLMRRAVS
jgi:Ca2+-transporting ATPase